MNRTVDIAQTVRLQWKISCNITNNERFKNLQILQADTKYAEVERDETTFNVTVYNSDWILTADVMANNLSIQIVVGLDVTVLSDRSLGNFLIKTTFASTFNESTHWLSKNTRLGGFDMRLGKNLILTSVNFCFFSRILLFSNLAFRN